MLILIKFRSPQLFTYLNSMISALVVCLSNPESIHLQIISRAVSWAGQFNDGNLNSLRMDQNIFLCIFLACSQMISLCVIYYLTIGKKFVVFFFVLKYQGKKKMVHLPRGCLQNPFTWALVVTVLSLKLSCYDFSFFTVTIESSITQKLEL